MGAVIHMTDAEHPGEPRPHLRVLPGGAQPGQRPDDELLRAFLVGDDAAFGELVERHQRTVLAVVRRYARDSDECFDLAQRAFLRALEAARKTLGRKEALEPVPFRAWLIRIAVNLGKNQVRDRARWRPAPLEAVDAVQSVEPLGADRLEREERQRLMRAAVLSLPDRQREVLTLRLDAELSFRQIGEALGITENNAKVHFHHAAKKLRSLLSGGES